MKEKHIEVVKEVRKREDYHYEKANFCRDHNMKLEEMFHRDLETELRRLASKLETILDTGYIQLEKYNS